MVSMRKKTIGEVLRLARINQGLSLEELHRRQIFSWICWRQWSQMILTNYRVLFMLVHFLRKYAWAVELDENIVLDAYDSGSMITYEES